MVGKLLTRICFFLMAYAGIITVQAQEKAYQFRINFKDKKATTYSLKRPQDYLSFRSIERRRKQHLPIDSTDLPVCKKYIQMVEQFPNSKIVAKGKWDNFVTVYTTDSTLSLRLQQLPPVKKVTLVWEGSDISDRQSPTTTWGVYPTPSPAQKEDNEYGRGYAQIHIHNGERLHREGFRGGGKMIAVIDAGFQNVDSIPLMNNISIVGVKNFTYPTQIQPYREHEHGLMVLSCMAMNKPGVMIGTAPDASYLLLKSEDENSETLVEQDYWAAATEYADSVGVDLINSSLGYTTFDDPRMNYQYHQLDGKYELISRQASRLADKGIILVCSAGNSGEDSWKKISVPADAPNIITVGAINPFKVLASFSSIGNTADGRVKPDVVAMGAFSSVIGPDGKLTMENGTSFSSPIMCGLVASLWQACPHLTAKQMIGLIRRVGDRHQYPDNLYGYGIPDVWKAYRLYLSSECSK